MPVPPLREAATVRERGKRALTGPADGERDDLGRQHRDEVGLGQADLQAAAAAIDVDLGARIAEGAGIDRRRKAPLLPERADAADMIARQSLGIGGLQHRGGLAREGCGDALHRDLPVGGDQQADGASVHRRHQGLQHPAGGDTQGLGGLEADARRVRIVSVGVQAVADARPCRGPASPGWISGLSWPWGVRSQAPAARAAISRPISAQADS